MSAELVRDCAGTPLAEGAHVEAWFFGVRYTATVKAIKPHHPDCEDHHHIILIRDGDHAEVPNTSNAVTVIGDDGGNSNPA